MTKIFFLKKDHILLWGQKRRSILHNAWRWGLGRKTTWIPILAPPCPTCGIDPKYISQPVWASLSIISKLATLRKDKNKFLNGKKLVPNYNVNILYRCCNNFLIIVVVSMFCSWLEIFDVFKRIWHFRCMFLSEILTNIYLTKFIINA